MSYDLIATDSEFICGSVDLEPLAGRTVLVTGASGLLGTYLLATLAHDQVESPSPHVGNCRAWWI
jgi:hypothetical protein